MLYKLSYQNGILMKAKISNEYGLFCIIRSMKGRPEYVLPAFWGPVEPAFWGPSPKISPK